MPDRPTHGRTHYRGAAGDWPGQPVGGPDSGPYADEPTVEPLSTQLEIAKSLAGRLRKTTADSATLIAAIIHDDDAADRPRRRT